MMMNFFKPITDFIHDVILVKKHGIALTGKAGQLDKLSVEELKEIADNINSIVVKRYCECLIEQRRIINESTYATDNTTHA